MFKLVLVAILALWANAYELSFDDGYINAHTEVLGDSNINPSTKMISSNLSKEDSIESLKGKININAVDLKSGKEKRDSNMCELLNVTIHPDISFEIQSVQKVEDKYIISGILTLNGISRNISSRAEIIESTESLSIEGGFDIELTDYGMQPPKMFFLTVRNKIDISYLLNYKKAN
ncbi:MAG: YceI family protein [Arcobacteraceae bacterium]|jgi:polyisoprenoid-binding protein YceI|nr:YceI family protein [Arcobacteraceae bacterium]MDY0326746.1 YceI family protein [Arcobacteraceae bacterium]